MPLLYQTEVAGLLRQKHCLLAFRTTLRRYSGLALTGGGSTGSSRHGWIEELRMLGDEKARLPGDVNEDFRQEYSLSSVPSVGGITSITSTVDKQDADQVLADQRVSSSWSLAEPPQPQQPQVT